MGIAKKQVIAATRFGLGARPGELATIGADARAWLPGQLHSPSSAPAAVGDLPPSARILAEFQAVRGARALQTRVFPGKPAARSNPGLNCLPAVVVGSV